MSALGRDRLLALLTLIGAASYFAAARAIEDSLLADAVGAGGVPQGVALMMMLVAVVLLARTLLVGQAARPGAGGAEASPPAAALASGPVLRTTAGVLILLAYAAVLPVAGYILSVSALVLASGWLAGAAFKRTLWLSAALAGPALWLLFDQLLQVHMPLGSLVASIFRLG